MCAKKRVTSKSSMTSHTQIAAARLETTRGASSTPDPAVGKKVGKWWTKAEHDRFLQAIEMYPRGPWKKIAEHVSTRSVRQVMSHAQKDREKAVRWSRGLQNMQAISRMTKTHLVSAEAFARAILDRSKTDACPPAESQHQTDHQAEDADMMLDPTFYLLTTPPLGPCLHPLQTPRCDPDEDRPRAIATTATTRVFDLEDMESLSLYSIDQDLVDTDMLSGDQLIDGPDSALLFPFTWWEDDCADESPSTTDATPFDSFDDSDIETVTCTTSKAEVSRVLAGLEKYPAMTW